MTPSGNYQTPKRRGQRRTRRRGQVNAPKTPTTATYHQQLNCSMSRTTGLGSSKAVSFIPSYRSQDLALSNGYCFNLTCFLCSFFSGKSAHRTESKSSRPRHACHLGDCGGKIRVVNLVRHIRSVHPEVRASLMYIPMSIGCRL